MRPYWDFPAENWCGYFIKPAILYYITFDKVSPSEIIIRIIVVNSQLYVTQVFPTVIGRKRLRRPVEASNAHTLTITGFAGDAYTPFND